ncbi:MAG: hypothetical protein K6G86_05750 [Bacteroidales bacterium]|nr:hypothetical protein [Bacteroidales bacterium]
MKEAMNEEYRLPDGLDKAAEDAILAAVLAEKGPDCLVPEPRPVSRRTHPALREKRPARRWLWGAVPAVALAALSLVLFIGHPAPIINNPEVQATYAQIELAFESFCDAALAGYDSFSENPFSR